MGEFPPLPAPPAEGVTALRVEGFLAALLGPPGAGVAPGADPAVPEPRLLAVDVRSPSEFGTGHILGAVNIPLFDDQARAVVGTEYAKNGRYEAIRAGLSRTNLGALVDALEGHGARRGDRVLVYCWRGGMRSGAVSWLFSLCGFNVSTLEGGYRSFRRWCKTVVGNVDAPAPVPVVVLGGCTGVGKTAVLQELRARGEQTLDLEGLANHRGSAFGSLGQPPQPSNETYENAIALAVRRLDPKRRLWLEHEAGHVGKVLVPFGVAAWVKAAPRGSMVIVRMDKELRVRRLVEDYCSEEQVGTDGWVASLKECISAGLAKKLGSVRVKEALQLLDKGQWSEVAAMMLEYYDKLYLRWASQTSSDNVVEVHCASTDAADNAARVLQAAAGTCCPACQPLTAAAPARTRRGGAPCEALGSSRVDDGAPPPERAANDANGDANGDAGGARAAGTCAAAGSTGRVPAEGAPATGRQGTCHCGEVVVSCAGEPLSVSYCHCSICRRLSGAPFSCQAVFTAEQVHLSLEPGASLQTLPTSRGVERSRCASCLAPVRATLLGGRFAAVPLGLLGGWRAEGANAVPECLRPRHHMYYRDRVMDVPDKLPKYVGAVKDGGKEGAQLPREEW